MLRARRTTRHGIMTMLCRKVRKSIRMYAPVRLSMNHQREPGLDVPHQTGHDYVGPVADQFVERYSQRVDAVFELLDDVLLIAALVRARDRPGRRQISRVVM